MPSSLPDKSQTRSTKRKEQHGSFILLLIIKDQCGTVLRNSEHFPLGFSHISETLASFLPTKIAHTHTQSKATIVTIKLINFKHLDILNVSIKIVTFHNDRIFYNIIFYNILTLVQMFLNFLTWNIHLAYVLSIFMWPFKDGVCLYIQGRAKIGLQLFVWKILQY